MNVVINSECAAIPGDVTLLTSEKNVALNLLFSLGYDPLNPPLGDLLRTIHHLEGNWVVLSPVRWQATHNDAMIIATDNELQLSEQESRHWFKLLSDYLSDDGMMLYYHDKHTWLLEVTNKPYLNARPVHRIMNHSLMPELAQLDSTMFWQKFFTECQMFFASQPNAMKVNGIWAWGAGTLVEKRTVPICSDECYVFLASICSNKVTVYNSLIRLEDYPIILLNEFTTLSTEHQHELLKSSVHWFWNDSAYAYVRPNWFTRIWRKFSHAH
ncbi:hypothetical protein [uncultured Legionella sp.]|uniref:hypothetical protein n=1 Tax=uncultured Legionella sp. TaxID=210934 RepID=UPI002620FFA6|nr:hypothetical protein [uncultured Legionella sp.]